MKNRSHNGNLQSLMSLEEEKGGMVACRQLVLFNKSENLAREQDVLYHIKA
jgi:hypothetical protein